MSAAAESVTLLLLRHAHVDGHRGDVPITELGRSQARYAGEWLADRGDDVAAVLYGGTRRSRETAEGILSGLGRERGGGLQALDAFALRNPDLYLGGDRVTMVSSAEAFAEQTRAMNAADVYAVPFFAQWLAHPERVGFWLTHRSPPGDDAASVARRMTEFARSLADVPQWRGRTVVGVTHSPVLRSVGLDLTGADSGEPVHVHGYEYAVSVGAEPTIQDVAPATSPTAP